MIIRELDIEGFGCLRDKRLTLDPGINLICGRNESGKSTAAAFVRCMFYGMRKGHGRNAARDDIHRYSPWDKSPARGAMIFSCRGRSFRLNREFPGQVSLFCTDDGEVLDVSVGDLAMLLGGLGEGLYESAVSSDLQSTLSDGLAASLESYLLNMETVQEEQTDVEKAVRLLEARAKAARAEEKEKQRRRQERQEELRNRIGYLERQKESLQGKKEKLTGERENLAGEEIVSSDTGKIRRRFLSAGICLFAAAVAVLSYLRGWTPAAGIIGLLGVSAGVAVWLFPGKQMRKNGKNAEDIEQKRLEYDARISQLEEEWQDALREQANCREEMGELDLLSAEERQLREDQEACGDAARRIRAAAAALSGDWSIRLTGKASDILRKLTGNAYSGVQMRMTSPPEVTVTDGNHVYDARLLSTGTADQIRMSVRLSAAMLLEEEPMPLLFDDAFLTWDDERLAKLLTWLSGCDRQVLIFSGQKREERLLIGENIPFRKIILDEP